MLSRRGMLVGLVSLPIVADERCRAETGPAAIESSLADLERAHGGRLGVQIVDVATGRVAGRRADERFAMCSTFKVLAAAAILQRVDQGADTLDRRLVYGKDRMVSYSPETERHIGEGMLLGAICKAALTLSDNTAGNLMLDTIGGPAALTAFARALGDTTTRLDRPETTLNEATPGDPRDTTTPAAMASNLRRLLLGDVLSARSRAQMTDWMVANTTGGKRLRAGVPAGWGVADKTGAGDHAATNDIAVLWPPQRGPRIVTAYYAESPAPDDARNAVLAGVGRLAASL